MWDSFWIGLLISLTKTIKGWLMELEMDYELNEQVNRMVFPCGAIVRRGVICIYYGGVDSVLGIATVKLKDVLKMLA